MTNVSLKELVTLRTEKGASLNILVIASDSWSACCLSKGITQCRAVRSFTAVLNMQTGRHAGLNAHAHMHAYGKRIRHQTS